MSDTRPSILAELDAYHRNHAYTLPSVGETIVSPLSGTAYTIWQRLDGGNFGEVFDCTDDWGHSLVAKIVKPLGDFAETETKALSEVAAAALVRSPHVVQIHDTFVYKGAFYIVSERCTKTLRDMMRGEKDYHAGVWFRALAKGVLHALHWVHMHELVHCDVHAGNVFLNFLPDAIVDDQSACKFQLGDFGQTRPTQNIEPAGTFLASLRPPEAFNATEFGPLDHRIDLYQAGLLFLNFLSGQEFVFTRVEILEGGPRAMAEGLPHPAASIISAMLRRHSTWRPLTARHAWLEIDQTTRAQ